MIKIEKPSRSNLIIETCSIDKNQGYAIYILNPTISKSVFKIGRGHDADLKIQDISVSRVHAIINVTPFGYKLLDNKSKFGSLVKKARINLIKNETMIIQLGRSMVEITLNYKNNLKKEINNVQDLKQKHDLEKMNDLAMDNEKVQEAMQDHNHDSSNVASGDEIDSVQNNANEMNN